MRNPRDSRHRSSLLAQVGPQLSVLADLLNRGDGADVRETAAFDLSRLADTAARLGLLEVAREARSASTSVAVGAGVEVLRRVARAVAAEGEAVPFGPIAVVASGERAARVAAQAETCADEILLFPSTDRLRADLVATSPHAVLLPSDDPEAIAIASAVGERVIAWGDADDFEQRRAALRAGAIACVSGLDVETALETIRWHQWCADEPPIGAVIGAPVAALCSLGFQVLPVESNLAALADGCAPDGLLVDDRARAAEIVPTLRGHPRWGRTAVAVVGTGEVDGADDVVPEVAAAAAALARRCARLRLIPNHSDPVTLLGNRPATLRSVDRMNAYCRRNSEVLALGLLAVDGLPELLAAGGVARVHRAQRVVAKAMTGSLRRLDVIGRVGPGLFLMALPSCRLGEAGRRLAEILDRIRPVFASDSMVQPLALSWGLTDSQPGAERLVERAWTALAENRRGI
jgi:GGDEF domain-containing protein